MSQIHRAIPAWTWIAPTLASALLALKFVHIVPSDATALLVLAGVLLAAAVFAAAPEGHFVA